MSETLEFLFKNLFFFLLYGFVVWAVISIAKEMRVPGKKERGTFLVVERADGTESRVALKGELKVGRAPDSDILLNDEFTSQQHARVQRRGGQIYLEDLESSNGTLLNGHKIAGVTDLRPGDIITVGRTNIRLERNVT